MSGSWMFIPFLRGKGPFIDGTAPSFRSCRMPFVQRTQIQEIPSTAGADWLDGSYEPPLFTRLSRDPPELKGLVTAVDPQEAVLAKGCRAKAHLPGPGRVLRILLKGIHHFS